MLFHTDHGLDQDDRSAQRRGAAGAARASTQLYVELMLGSDSGLTRSQREMIAVVVSRANGCHY